MATSIQFSERLKKVLPVWLAWLAGYEFLLWIGYDETYFDTVLQWEKSVSVVEWWVIPYFITYPFVVIAPLTITEKEVFKRYLRETWIVVLSGLFFQFILPLYATPRPFVPITWMGELILWERSYDGPAAAFPSFHALWGFVTARWLSAAYPHFTVLSWFVALMIMVSCFGTGNHSVLDLVAAVLLYSMIAGRERWVSFFKSR